MTNIDDNNYIKVCDSLQQDFKLLISETRRKYPSIKESGENVQKILKDLITRKGDIKSELLVRSATIVQPLLQGCNTQLPKAVSISLTGLQRLATHNLMTEEAAAALIGVLWGLMEAGIEEVKLLQTTILLITTNDTVKSQNLARALGLCFRLHDSKNSSTVNTATAALRQCISSIVDRMVAESCSSIEQKSSSDVVGDENGFDYDIWRQNPRQSPASLRGSAKDVFMLFQDLCLLINKDETIWLQGLNGVMQTLGLELLELILVDYTQIFTQFKEFTFLLKEKVCPLIIKLFSPSLKFKPNLMTSSVSNEKPNFPLIGRLIRLITVIIRNYFYLLNTECEIFISLLIRFLENEKPVWQRVLALEVLYKCVSEPLLIKHICENYDMKEHATNIFKEMVNSLSNFVQSCFLNSSVTQSNSGVVKDATLSGLSNTVTIQPSFKYKGNYIPIYMNLKILFYDMLDKSEPPNPPDGYSLSLAFLSLIEIIKSVQAIVESNDANLKLVSSDGNEKLIEACWGGVLNSMSILLESSQDEAATEALLRSFRSMISLCGEIGFSAARNAFVATICKASLPSTIARTILNDIHGMENFAVDNVNFADNKDLINGPINTDDAQLNHSGAISYTNGTSPNISDKNIQCVRSLLNVAHCHGNLLGSSWNMVLLCLQHIVSLLGLTVTSVGSIVMTRSGGNVSTNNYNATAATNAVNLNAFLSPAVIADLPVLSAMLSRLFECSQLMDEKALTDLIEALCKLTNDAIEIGKSNKEPSLFSVAKLMETGLANTKRPEIWWNQILPTLIEASSQSHVSLRQQAADSTITLIKEVIKVESLVPFWTNKEIYDLVLNPLCKMSYIKFCDVRQKQLDCIQYLLHRYGDQIGDSWHLIIEIIGAIDYAISEQLVRNAFQCFQIVNTDYLVSLNNSCYSIMVIVASRFSKQDQDLNISLSAIGSIWYIADFFYQQVSIIEKSWSKDQIDDLWIEMYCNLVEICVDKRPAVRKSAGQTLFNTLDVHGGVLQQNSWSVVMWKVLFPLLDKVKEFCAVASEKKNNENLLMHHSRDTAAKQWAETQVLTLGGVAQIFANKQEVLLKLDDFPKAWKLLLEIIEASALLSNQEMSENSLKSMQLILAVNFDHYIPTHKSQENLKLMVWHSWTKIGTESTSLASSGNLSEKLKNREKITGLPSQKFLTILFEIFPQLFSGIQSMFSADDFQHFNIVLKQTLIIHLIQFSCLSEPAIVNSLSVNSDHGYLSPLQKTILESLKALSLSILTENSKLNSLLGMFFTATLSLANYCVQLPREIQTLSKLEKIPDIFISFGENCMDFSVDLYKSCAQNKLVISNCVQDQIISMLYLPLSLKYNCPSQSTWLLANQCLMSVMQIGITIAKKNEKQSIHMWEILSKTLEDFLFSNQPCPPGLSVEEFQKNQDLDCKFIHLIKELILSDSDGVPDSFIEDIIRLLNTGTIDNSSSHFTDYYLDIDNFRSFREDFARLCFETLLEYSYLTPQNKPDQRGSQKAGTVSRAAVKATLEKCHSVLKQYVEDEKLSGKCPLPRSRLLEVGFVFKALCTLLTAFESAQPRRIDSSTWDQIIELYPLTVDCVTVTGAHFMKPLREVLHKYKYLLNPKTN